VDAPGSDLDVPDDGPVMNAIPVSLEVPEWLRPAIGQATAQLPEALVREMGGRLAGGFTKRAAILTAWQRRDQDFARITTEHADWLRETQPSCRVLRALDPLALTECLPTLVGVLGADEVRLALWLDRRESVARLAQPEFPASLPAAQTDPTVARQAWLELVRREFLRPFGLATEVTPGSAPGAGPALRSEAPAGGRELAGESDLDRHRGWLKQAQKALTEEKTARAQELAELKRTHARTVEELTVARDQARSALAKLEAETGTRIRAEVSAALDAQVRPWLTQAVELDAAVAVAGPEFERLTRAVSGALERQRQADRHQGNRTTLRKELAALLAMREQVATAAGDALQPLAEWPALLRQLDAAIAHRRQLLGDLPAQAPAWMPELSADLAVAGNAPAVDTVGQRAETLAGAGLLAGEVLAWFRGQVALRRSAVADPLRQGLAAPPVRLGDLLRGGQAGLILVDAFNWIGRAGDELGVSSKPERFTDSLKRLEPMLRRVAGRAERVVFVLVADGPDTHHHDLAPNVRILWSGGTGPHRADGVLLGELRHRRGATPGLPIFVVTEDGEVRRQAKGLGAGVEECVGFARRLKALLQGAG
jgi:hypothetical protein